MYEDVMADDEPAFGMLPFPPVPKPATRGGPLRDQLRHGLPGRSAKRGPAAGNGCRKASPSQLRQGRRSVQSAEGFEAPDDLRDLPGSLVAPNKTIWSDTKTPK